MLLRTRAWQHMRRTWWVFKKNKRKKENVPPDCYSLSVHLILFFIARLVQTVSCCLIIQAIHFLQTGIWLFLSLFPPTHFLSPFLTRPHLSFRLFLLVPRIGNISCLSPKIARPFTGLSICSFVLFFKGETE